jgi:hypothetical protein
MRKIFFFALLFIYQLAVAQDDAGEAEIYNSREAGLWYESPWLWVVGAGVVIFLLVAMSREKKE